MLHRQDDKSSEYMAHRGDGFLSTCAWCGYGARFFVRHHFQTCATSGHMKG